MIYPRTREAVFLDRPNRFVAEVELEGKRETVHVKNTGRCRELLLPGARVILAPGERNGRKTAWDLITVWKTGLGWVNIDSQAPNRAVREWLDRGGIPGLTAIHPEYADTILVLRRRQRSSRRRAAMPAGVSTFTR